MLKDICIKYSEEVSNKIESTYQKYANTGISMETLISENKIDVEDSALLFAGAMFQIMLITLRTSERSLEESLKLLKTIPKECVEDAWNHSIMGDESMSLGFLILSRLTATLTDLLKLEQLAKNL